MAGPSRGSTQASLDARARTRWMSRPPPSWSWVHAACAALALGGLAFERALVELVRSQRVSKEDALAQSDSPTNLLWLLENTEDSVADAAAAAQRNVPEAPAAAKPAEGPTFSEFMLNI